VEKAHYGHDYGAATAFSRACRTSSGRQGVYRLDQILCCRGLRFLPMARLRSITSAISLDAAALQLCFVACCCADEDTLGSHRDRRHGQCAARRERRTGKRPSTWSQRVSEAENLSVHGRFLEESGRFSSRRIQHRDLIGRGCGGWERERATLRSVGGAGQAGAGWRCGTAASHGLRGGR
jgi:hypothetical protein